MRGGVLMAIRILWDEYEAAYLLLACIDVIENRTDRATAIKKVSEALRKRALHNGIVIDSMYRNENGISMQMTIMSSLYLHKKSGLHGASKLFVDTVELYEKNPKAIKDRVKDPVEGGAKLNMSNREDFHKWLIASVRLGDLSNIKRHCDLVDAYIKNHKKFQTSIYELNDLQDVQKIKEFIEKDVFFKAKNSRQIYHILKSMDIFYDFIANHTKTNPKEENASKLDIASQENKEKEMEVPTQEKEFVTFLSEDKLSYTKPVCIEYKGITYSDFSNWTQLYVRVLKILFEENKNILINLCGKNITGTGRVEIAAIDQVDQMIAPKEFADGLYVETNISATDITKKIAGVLSYYEIKVQEFKIYFERKHEQTPSNDVPVKKTKPSDSKDFIDADKYKTILLTHYRKGFRLNDKLSVRRFRMQWKSAFDLEVECSDEELCENVMKICIRHGDMAYLPDVMLDESKRMRLLAHIRKLFSEGKNVIYYESLFKEFTEDFEDGRINNADMLKTYLSHYVSDKMCLEKKYIASDSNVEIDLTEEVRNFLIEAGTAVATDEIVAALSHITRDKVVAVLAGINSEEFIRNQKGEYFHESIVEFTSDEMAKIVNWIKDAIDDKEYMGGKELVDLIDKNLPDIHDRYSFLTWLGLRDVIGYKLKDEFSFKGKIISAYSKALSMTNVFGNFAKSHDYFTLDQLNTLKTDLDTSIYFDAVYNNSLRINKDEFVSKDKAKFDVTATDFAIEMFCSGDYVSLKDVNLFGGFPDAYFSWNAFLLQHYVANYSKKFKLLHAGFTASNPVGAIVKRNSSLDTFDDVVIRAVAESNVSLNSNNILEFLCASGYLARKSYGKMDELINKANLLRMNKGD